MSCVLLDRKLYAGAGEGKVPGGLWSAVCGFCHLLAGIVLFLLIGCAGRAPRLEREVSPRELYLRVAENYRRLQSFEGNGRLTVESQQFQLSAPMRILVQKPDSLFLKVEAGLGIDVGFFFADRKQFASFSPLDNIYYYGDTEKMRGLAFFRLDLTYDEMMSGMIGAALPPFDSSFIVTRDGEGYRFDGRRKQRLVEVASSLTSANGDTAVGLASDTASADYEIEWQLTYWIDAKRGVVTTAEQRDGNGELYARQAFKRFHQVRGVWLPQLIQMERPAEQERLTLFYNDVKANARIPPAKFVIHVPKTAKRVKISDPEDLLEARKLKD